MQSKTKSLTAVASHKTRSQSVGKTIVYNQQGKKVGTIQLPSIFSTEIKPHLIHKAVLWQIKKTIPSTAHTKTRSQRRGGGKKPWRQKGTGRARTGSLRSPIFRKGGVVFGPTPEKNFTIKILKKEKRQALLSILSSKAIANKIIVLDKLKLTQIKTKKMEEILAKLKILGTILLIIDKKDEKVKKSANNLPYLKLISADSLNILDLVNWEYLLITKDGINKINQIYGEKNGSN